MNNPHPSQPLLGRRIIVTLTHPDDLTATLTDLGATVDSLPLINIAPPLSWQSLDDALASIDQFDWLIFTSANGVSSVAGRARTLGLPWPGTVAAQIAVVGPATAEACVAEGLRPTLIPERHDTQGLIQSFRPYGPARILLPQSALADETLSAGLTAAGHTVVAVTAYRPIPNHDAAQRATTLINDGAIQALVVSSPSSLAVLLSDVDPPTIPQPIVCLGTRTAQACTDAGLTAVISPDANPNSVAAAMVELLANR